MSVSAEPPLPGPLPGLVAGEEAGDGRRFGPYRLLRLIGRGGMGQVWHAHDEEHDRDVALKVLNDPWASDETYRERFRREARVVARLREPHVIPIHRYGEIEGRLFLDMRLVEGENLAARIAREGALPPAFAVDLVGQVAAALDAAHADGLVHRDVKPSNVLLARGEVHEDPAATRRAEFAYLVDFGIAATTADEQAVHLTGTGLAIGSAGYMAPERYDGRTFDRRSDVYSLACVFVELLTGRPPFLAPDAAGLMYAHLQQLPPPPSLLLPGLPPALDAVVLRGLAKDPQQRWASAGQLADAAREALSAVPAEPRVATSVQPARLPTSDQPLDRPPAAPGPPRAPRPRSRWWPAAVLALAVATAAGWSLWAYEVRGGRDAAAGAEQRLLREYLPDDVDPADCTVTDVPDGALTALSCGPSATDGGPTEAVYVLYPEGGAADSAFDDDVGGAGLGELDDPGDCSSDTSGAGAWAREDDDGDPVPAGRFACYVDGQGDSVVTWTSSTDGFRAAVQIRGGGEDGLSGLESWWDGHGAGG